MQKRIAIGDGIPQTSFQAQAGLQTNFAEYYKTFKKETALLQDKGKEQNEEIPAPGCLSRNLVDVDADVQDDLGLTQYSPLDEIDKKASFWVNVATIQKDYGLNN